MYWNSTDGSKAIQLWDALTDEPIGSPLKLDKFEPESRPELVDDAWLTDDGSLALVDFAFSDIVQLYDLATGEPRRSVLPASTSCMNRAMN